MPESASRFRAKQCQLKSRHAVLLECHRSVFSMQALKGPRTGCTPCEAWKMPSGTIPSITAWHALSWHCLARNLLALSGMGCAGSSYRTMPERLAHLFSGIVLAFLEASYLRRSMINNEPAFRYGQTVRIYVDGRPSLTGTIEAVLPSLVNIGAEQVYEYAYRVAISSSMRQGLTNHLWVPEQTMADPAEVD